VSITGVTRDVFTQILRVLTDEHDRIRKTKGGNPVGPKLTIALEYWREYRAMRQLTFDYQMSMHLVGPKHPLKV